jgi:hypothetical protein
VLILAISGVASGCAGLGDAPRHGRIAFFDPATGRRTSSGARIAPSSLEYVSADDLELGAPDTRTLDERLATLTPDEIRSRARFDPRTFEDERDARETGLDPRDAAKRAASGRLLENSRPITVPPEDFAGLWSELIETGIERLPRHPAIELPEEEPFILLDDGKSQRVFLRPDTRVANTDDPEEIRELFAVWNAAKTLLAVRN